jgi:hypothetical protein
MARVNWKRVIIKMMPGTVNGGVNEVGTGCIVKVICLIHTFCSFFGPWVNLWVMVNDSEVLNFIRINRYPQ